MSVKKRSIFGNPWVYLEASYQADRTYTTIVRAFAKRYPDVPYLPQLAGMLPIALMAAVRRVTGFEAGQVEIDFVDLAERHFGRGHDDPSKIALEVINFWKGRDSLAAGFRLKFNDETGIATVEWPAFAERYDADRRFSELQAKRRKGKAKTPPESNDVGSGSTNAPQPTPLPQQNIDRASQAEIREAMALMKTTADNPRNNRGSTAVEPRNNHSLTNELSSDLGAGKTLPEEKIGAPTPKIIRGAELPTGRQSYPEDQNGPVITADGLVAFLSFEEYQAVALSTPDLVPDNCVLEVVYEQNRMDRNANPT